MMLQYSICYLILIKAAKLCVCVYVCMFAAFSNLCGKTIQVRRLFDSGEYNRDDEEQNRVERFKISDREVGVISIFIRVGRVFASGSWSIEWSEELK